MLYFKGSRCPFRITVYVCLLHFPAYIQNAKVWSIIHGFLGFMAQVKGDCIRKAPRRHFLLFSIVFPKSKSELFFFQVLLLTLYPREEF